MAYDDYNDPSLASPCANAEEWAASDVTEHDPPCRALYVGTGGDVAVVTAAGDTVTFINVPDGAILPVRVTQVLATGGTTASNFVGIW